ncbi:hypothetical protein BB559_003670 [Furculomyces boomerangus]|uniref:Uncharacterized protein n=2 Tax=Harpellales TaxID=61421 RepID=A0A2T9YJM4_9FUNG|nr:hypothetical protein BB559_003670 [Furculomyces boomerangus]PWA02856.1 hypothetical protein BB558_000985 [Smittium angustum]
MDNQNQNNSYVPAPINIPAPQARRLSASVWRGGSAFSTGIQLSPQTYNSPQYHGFHLPKGLSAEDQSPKLPKSFSYEPSKQSFRSFTLEDEYAFTPTARSTKPFTANDKTLLDPRKQKQDQPRVQTPMEKMILEGLLLD